MPVYQSTKTYKGGFYNSKIINGNNDRVYSAEDIRKPYDTVFTDGIMPEADGAAGETLKVKSYGGMTISVNPGNAKLGGAWFENTALYTITLDTAGTAARYDCVILRNDDSDEIREPSIYIKSLTAKPTYEDLTREGKVFEVCLAYVLVPALAESITDDDIVDTRVDGRIDNGQNGLCNVMSGVGAMVVRTYRSTVYSERVGQTGVTIEIPQFDRTRDHLTVIVEGRILSEDAYTIPSNTYVELDLGLPVVGTRVDFEVRKNVNAAGADTVVQEVGTLLNEMAVVRNKLENHYYCNGRTDNVNISTIIKNFLQGDDNGSLDLKIHGHFGATAPVSGSGVSTSAYKWFDFSIASPTRRVTIDFTDCSPIELLVTNATYNIVFFGDYVRIIGANVIVNNSSSGTNIRVFSSAKGEIFAEYCRFWITGYSGCSIAECGTFTNCRASVANTTGHSYCFASASTTLIRVNGGEYYAYTASSSHYSAVAGLTSGADAVMILSGVNAPTASRSGYNQTHSLYQTTGMLNCRDMISALTTVVVSGASNIQGTIAKSKAGLM